jgi:hypothetical protein
MTTSTDIQAAQQAGDLAQEMLLVAKLPEDVARRAYSATVDAYLRTAWGKNPAAAQIAAAQAAANLAHEMAPDGEKYDAYRKTHMAVMKGEGNV